MCPDVTGSTGSREALTAERRMSGRGGRRAKPRMRPETMRGRERKVSDGDGDGGDGSGEMRVEGYKIP